MKEEETTKMTLRVPSSLWQRFHDHCEERLMTKNKLMIRKWIRTLKPLVCKRTILTT